VARDLGIKSPETLRAWVRQAEIDRGLKAGPSTDELAEIRQLLREVADQQRKSAIPRQRDGRGAGRDLQGRAGQLHGPWKTRRQLEIAIIEWIDWYNASRLHREIGDIPPFEHEAHWYLQNTPAVVAGPQ
jgi:transposase InsO family protein